MWEQLFTTGFVGSRLFRPSWQITRYDALDPTSTDVATVGLKMLAAHTQSAKVNGAPFRKPIVNFYHTDPISRACVISAFPSFSEIDQRRGGTYRSVTIAQCTRAFVKGEQYGFSESEKSSQAVYA